MRRALLSAAGLAWLAALGACSSGSATNDPALDARMRIAGAQFVRGPMPAGSPGGPHVASITVPNDNVRPSFSNDPISGALDPSATAAAIGIDGDVGYWLVLAGAPSVATPGDPTYAVLASFAADLAPGPYTLVVRAVDASGAFGPPSTETLTSTATPLPTGALVVTLAWDTEADLDLHVIDPSGDDVFHGNPSSAPPITFGQGDADAGVSYGYLDFDSNAECRIDGLRREDVIWSAPPPSGHYVVRVDTASLCAAPIAQWVATATLEGSRVGGATGTSVDADTRGPHDRGAGVTAFEFDVP
jgi:hypothetical protein